MEPPVLGEVVRFLGQTLHSFALDLSTTGTADCVFSAPVRKC